jgi:hypothetical protein
VVGSLASHCQGARQREGGIVSRIDVAVRVAAIVSMLVSAAAILIFAISWRQHNPPCPSGYSKLECYAASTR